ncbi:MAG TPA: hemerythrin domain-containing protein [Acidimicrobiales bacterium]|nr:hemerythrin domain-containing protein [Acidimicrobiales bacterium]
MTDRKMGQNSVTEMLKEDHKEVNAMFRSYEGADEERRDRLVHEIIESLTKHTRVEEQILYPFIRAEVPGGDQLMDEAEQEHQEAKDAIARLRELSPGDPAFDDAFQALREGMQHHVEEEESEVFPKVTEAADDEALVELGSRLAQAKALSPRTPRPTE